MKTKCHTWFVSASRDARQTFKVCTLNLSLSERKNAQTASFMGANTMDIFLCGLST